MKTGTKRRSWENGKSSSFFIFWLDRDAAMASLNFVSFFSNFFFYFLLCFLHCLVSSFSMSPVSASASVSASTSDSASASASLPPALLEQYPLPRLTTPHSVLFFFSFFAFSAFSAFAPQAN